MLNPEEERVYNNGERLIPGISHDLRELLRHRGVYRFWYEIIRRDMAAGRTGTRISIVDLGCGVGHGCALLSRLPNAVVTGVDFSGEAIAYARAHYAASNISYVQADLSDFVATMEPYDYVVSRNALEHINNGLEIIERISFNHRLAFDVPYNEAPVNPYHYLHYVRADSLAGLANTEVIYEDTRGTLYDALTGNRNIINIMGLSHHDSFPPICELGLHFPIEALSFSDLMSIPDLVRAIIQVEDRLEQLTTAIYEHGDALQQVRTASLQSEQMHIASREMISELVQYTSDLELRQNRMATEQSAIIANLNRQESKIERLAATLSNIINRVKNLK